MRRHVLVYGVAGGLLIVALRLVEYRWLVLERSVEIYGAIVAALFAAMGLWLGRRFVRPVAPVEGQADVRDAVPPPATFVPDDVRRAALGITPRELQMLEAIAEGLSNKEIGRKLHVSENTVKTHSSRVFGKLDARRRTEAVQIARGQRLIR